MLMYISVNFVNRVQQTVSSIYLICATFKMTYDDIIQNAMNQGPIGESLGENMGSRPENILLRACIK